MCDTELNISVHDGTRTETPSQNDIPEMTKLLENRVTTKIPGRHIQSSQPFERPFDIGWNVAIGKHWIKIKVSEKNKTIEDFECDDREYHNDMKDIEITESVWQDF